MGQSLNRKINENFAANAEQFFMRLLNDSKTSGGESFLTSVPYEQRLSITLDHDLRSDLVSIYRTLPKWLIDNEIDTQLGPYERDILSDLMTREAIATVALGGARSGKSSLFAHLLSYAAEFGKRHDWKSRTGFPSFMCMISFSGLPSAYQEPETTRSHGSSDFVTVFKDLCKFLAQTIPFSFARAAGNTEEGQKVFYRLFRAEYSFATGNAGVYDLGVRAAMFNAVDIECKRLFSGKGVKECDWAQLQRAIYNINNEEMMFMATLMPFFALGRIHAEMEEPARFLLVLDNLDAIASDLQRKLGALFASLDTNVDTIDLKHPGLCICLPFRYGSFEDPQKQFGVRSFIHHKAPEPSELVFYKLTDHLLRIDDTRDKKTNSAENEYFERLNKTLFMLWIRLLDETEEFVRVFNGLSGSNLQSAYTAARAWLNTMFRAMGEPRYNFSEEARKFVLRVFAPRLLEVIGVAVGRGLGYQIVEKEKIGQETEGAAKVMAELIVGTLVNVLVFNRVVYEVSGVKGGAIRCTVVRMVRKVLDEQFSPDEDCYHVLAGYDKGIELGLVDVIGRGVKYLSDLDCTILLQNRTAMIEDAKQLLMQDGYECPAWLDNLIPPIVERLVEVANSHIDYQLRSEQHIYRTLSSLKVRYQKGSKGVIVSWGKENIVIERFPSRYRSMMALLEPTRGVSESELSVGALNVFSLDKHSVNTLPIQILGLLYRRKSQFTAGGLIREVSLTHKLPDIRAAISELKRYERRLIYYSTHDHLLSVDDFLERKERELHLTWAGRLYLEIVVCNPVYLQWALDQLEEVNHFVKKHDKEIGVSGKVARLGRTFLGLKCICDKEQREYEKKMEESRLARGEVSFVTTGVVASILFRSMPAFISELEEVKRESKESALALARKWLEYGEEVISWYSDKEAQSVVEPWLEFLDTSKAKIEKVF